MKLLEEHIVKDGTVLPGNIVKVDSFLNHQIDPQLMDAIADEFYRLFGDKKITKIITVEASGIAIAIMTAKRFGVPALFAKKARSANIDSDLYTSAVKSYTYGNVYTITASKQYLNNQDHVLIVDDFLAMGSALTGLIDIVRQSGATIEGVGVCIEKAFQPGGKHIRDMGLPLQSLAMIESISEDGQITFVPQKEEK